MKYIVTILSIAILISCKSRQIEVKTFQSTDESQNMQSVKSESRDSVSIESNYHVDEVADIVTETTTTTYYNEAGVIQRQEQFTRTINKSEKKASESLVYAHESAFLTDTLRYSKTTKIISKTIAKAESKPTTGLWIAYSIIIMLVIAFFGWRYYNTK